MTDNMFRWDRTDDGIVTLTMDDPNAPVNTMNQTFQDDVRATVEKLEQEIGVQLLRRTTRRVPLIPRRRGFLAGGPQTLKSAKAARRITGQAAAGQAGVIRLGFSAQTSYQVMHLLVRKFRQRFPLVRFEVLSPLSGGELSDRTSQHEVDVGLLRLPVSAPGLHVRELESHPLVAALPADHPWAGRAVVELPEPQGEGFICSRPVAARW
ncbi:MAG: LysR substrate-binding domain-containing protein [Saccharopolyspora rectivirgula]